MSLNRLFEKEGWLTLNNGSISDWKVVCLGSGGSGFVRLKDPTDREFKKIVHLLLSKQDAFEILEQRHMNGVLWAPRKTDFVLLANDGYGFVRSTDQPFIVEKTGGSGQPFWSGGQVWNKNCQVYLKNWSIRQLQTRRNGAPASFLWDFSSYYT